MKGLLIAIEGINGSGKSTLIAKLVNELNAMDRKVKVYKFPDRSGKYGKQIDEFLNNKASFEYKYDMLNAFAMNRLAVRKNIKKDIKEGNIVICDRYFFSGIVYHIPVNASRDTIKVYSDVIGHFDTKMPIPDITYLIKGNYLYLRNENAQRFHYDDDRSTKLFDIFRNVIGFYTTYIILSNEYGELDALVKYIISNINTFVFK